MPLWRYLFNGGTRACEIAHRRWGKDEIALHWSAFALQRRVGAWWHCLPEYAQARKAIWNQVNPHSGRRRIDEAFPHELRKRTLEHEMFIEFHNGSTWQVIGSDNYDHLVGSSPLGLTMSEWAIAMPAAWAYFAPILEENGGTALFITTPRGKNHAYNTYKTGLGSPEWFAEICDVTRSGFPLERVEKQRAEYHGIFGLDAGDAMIEQEYFCSFDAAVLGSIFGREISQLKRAGRLRNFYIDPSLPVHRSWDLGISKSDAMAIWFFQWVGPDEIRYVDYIEGFQQPISHYADRIRAKGYPRGTRENPAIDFVPHDAKVKSMQTGMTRVEAMISAGLNPKLVPDHYVEDRHSATRICLPKCYFHERCADALEVLAAYQYEYDEKIRTFRKVPLHNYASHNASSFGYSCVAWKAPDFVKKPGSGRALLIRGDGISADEHRPQVTIDDVWAEHRRQQNELRRQR